MFPSSVRALEETQMLDAGARMRLGQGVAASEEAMPSWMSLVAPSSLPRVDLHVELRERELQVIGRHQVSADDRAALPAGAVIVELADSAGPITLGLGEGAYTGFVSWLEASSSPQS